MFDFNDEEEEEEEEGKKAVSMFCSLLFDLS